MIVSTLSCIEVRTVEMGPRAEGISILTIFIAVEIDAGARGSVAIKSLCYFEYIVE
jgi:hypothetical protein